MARLNVHNTPVSFQPPVRDYGEQPRPYSHEPDLNSPLGRTEAKVVDALKKVFDPELPVDIFELGLIYGVAVTEKNEVNIRMTLTTPNCPVAQSLPEQARQAAAQVEGVTNAFIELVWEPPWNPGMMTEAARLEANI
jgi:FeS assembly SUF system protein